MRTEKLFHASYRKRITGITVKSSLESGTVGLLEVVHGLLWQRKEWDEKKLSLGNEGSQRSG